MSSISGISSASNAWSDAGSARASRADRLFSKVDANGDGSVDKSELQGMLDHIAQKTGGTALSADDEFSKLDTDGDGKISKDELAAGIKSLLPPPSSTVDFASRGPGGPDGSGGSPPAPPSGSSASSSSSTDPLDTNGDGVVSAEERAAGDLKTFLQDLIKVADTDGDSKVSGSEADSFAQKLFASLDASSASTGTTSSSSSSDSQSSSSSSSSSDAQQQSFDFSALTALVLKQYASVASTAASGVGSSLSIAA